MAKYDPNDIEDEKDLIEFGEAFMQASAKKKRKDEQQWLLNIAFVAGDQLTRVNRQTGNLDRVPIEADPDWYVRIVDNRTLPIFRTMVAKLTKNKPLPSAKALSREDADVQAARAAVKLEESHWNSLQMSRKHVEMVEWLVSTGNCFYKQFWNPEKGDQVMDLSMMNTEAGLSPEGLPYFMDGGAMEQIFNLGDTDLVIRSPFNVFPQPGKMNLETATMIGDTEVMSAEEVKERFGKEVKPESKTKNMKIDLATIMNSGGMSEFDAEEDSITVKEMYILPCKRFKNGIMFQWAGDQLLSVTEECKKLPYRHFKLIGIPGKFWGRSIVDDIIPIQRRWNHLLSKVEMHNDYYNDPPSLFDPNLLDIDAWTNEPGLLLPVEGLANYPNKPVITIDVPVLDPSIFNELNLLDAQFELVPILNKVSYGKESPNARSGIAINFLQEKDDDIIRPFIENLENGYADVFKYDFQLCQEYYEEDRGFAIVGEDNQSEWLEFKRVNLDANIDVGVEPGSAMPRSKVAQQSMVMDMLEAGFFTDPQTGVPDFPRALKYLEFGSVDDIYQDATLDSNQAKRENDRMKKGEMAIPEYWHNHQTHVFEHLRFMKSADFENMPPDLQMPIREHLQLHEQMSAPAQSALPAPVGNSMGQQAGQMGPAGQAGGQPGQSPQATPLEMAGGRGQNPNVQFDVQIQRYLQSIEQQDPMLYQQLMQLPPQQMMQKVMEVMQVQPQPAEGGQVPIQG